jgi:hypothetical protein
MTDIPHFVVVGSTRNSNKSRDLMILLSALIIFAGLLAGILAISAPGAVESNEFPGVLTPM